MMVVTMLRVLALRPTEQKNTQQTNIFDEGREWEKKEICERGPFDQLEG